MRPPPAGREGGHRRRWRWAAAAGAMSESNADWMGSLPAALRSYPLSNLAIPGRAARRGGVVWVAEPPRPVPAGRACGPGRGGAWR